MASLIPRQSPNGVALRRFSGRQIAEDDARQKRTREGDDDWSHCKNHAPARDRGGGHAAIVKQGQALLVFRFQIVLRDARKILNVAERLRFGVAQILAGGFVFHQNDAGPEKINVAVVAGNFLHRLFKAGHRAAGNAEDLKKFIPESLLLRALAFRARPVA